MVIEQLLFRLYYIRFRATRIDQMYRRCCIRAANFLLPLVYRWGSRRLPSFSGQELNRRDKYIVSLTSFPERYPKLWLTLASLLRQERRPDGIVLCLPADELADLKQLPPSLQRMQRLGVEVIHCPYNLMPHNKYHAAASKYPKANIITVDDDVIYPPNLLKKLIAQHRQYPAAICCGLSRRITVRNNEPAPYQQWPYVAERTGPRKDNLVMGVGGALYPSGFFTGEILDAAKISSLCLKADDLWLTIHAFRKGFEIACIAGDCARMPLPVINQDDKHLSHENVSGRNDLYFQQLLHYYCIPAHSFVYTAKAGETSVTGKREKVVAGS